MDSAFGVESTAYVAVRATLSICAILLLGALALRFAVLWRYAGPDVGALRDAVDRRLSRWIDTLGIVAVLATFGRLAAQHAAVFGTDVAPSRQTLSTLLIGADWGRAWWAALASALVITWVAPRRCARSAPGWGVLWLSILIFAATQPWSGHPAAEARPVVAIATQLVHVIGAGGWVGGLALLTFIAIPAAMRIDGDGAGDAHARIAGLMSAFSPTALVFAALLMLTGLFTAWGNLGSVAALWQSAYGRTLVLKIALLSVVAGTGAYNWRRVLPSLGRPAASSALRRSSLIEIAAGLLVLVVTAVLVATPMPGE